MKEKKKYLINNAKERLYVNIGIGILILAFIIVILLILGSIDLSFIAPRTLRNFKKLAGNIALIGFTISFALFVVRRVMKLSFLKDFKKYIMVLAKYVRQFHAPIALVAGAFISLHAYFMLQHGFIMNTTYITGLSALILIGIQLIAGFFRYKRIGVKFHLILGIITMVLMVIHWLVA
ncbi:hypothetical protein SAMN02745163_01927 [Clostridium cavendishii DSM 21758]|uniref:Uncharacterized protein n=1 Tax=Clostridium cavendishii DSM 21758 TaxID=1121302 RepID=A0A1M6J6B2_9CLOT|nr:hypothetical protein [Clostridium cavendishii]SHJ42230.1 hypothetical protein SAMN02745163_01927 [Clostridium cavendishii DSM 21758]